MGKILNHRNEENIKENKEKTLQKTDFRDRNKQMKRCQNQRGKLMMMWDTSVISVWSSEHSQIHIQSPKPAWAIRDSVSNNNKKELEEKDLGDSTIRH